MSTSYIVKPRILQDICKNILCKNGIPVVDAESVADSLIDADLHNISSHGVLRMSVYMERIRKGGIIRNPDIKTINETENMIVLYGGRRLITDTV